MNNRDSLSFPKHFPKGIPYYPISSFYKEKFGGRTYKIPVTIAQSCPNRDGLKGMETCIFCDPWGSAAYPELRKLQLQAQMRSTKDHLLNLGNPKHFLLYFQSYTSTYQKVSQLKKVMEESVALFEKEPSFCKGFVLGTRPDCLSGSVFDLINSYLDKGFYISVELGVQSFHDPHLEWMKRGHDSQKSLKAIRLLRKECPNVDLGLHFILGFPEESAELIKKTAQLTSSMPIDNVKLHNLHVLKNTELEKRYEEKSFTPLSRQAYSDKVISFLEHLNPAIAVQRLSALSTNKDELVAPLWTADKMATYQFIIDEFFKKNSYQGKYYS